MSLKHSIPEAWKSDTRTWNTERREEYEKVLNNTTDDIIANGPELSQVIAPSQIHEHIDMAIQVADTGPTSMEAQEITKDEVLR